MGTGGNYYCPNRIIQAITTSPPHAKVNYATTDAPSVKSERKFGACLVPDITHLPLIEQLRRLGFANQSDLIDELTERYGGDLFSNALHARELTQTTDKLVGEMSARLRKIDVITELPRVSAPSPTGHGSPRYVRRSRRWPDGTPCKRRFGSGGEYPSAPTTKGCNWASGRYRFPPPVMTRPIPVAPSSLSTAPNTQVPIPGVNSAGGGALSNNALLTSMVYHMGRLANPDVRPKPGTLDAIRRNDEIYVYISRFFDNYTVTLRPLDGRKAIGFMSKIPEWATTPALRFARKIPTWFENRFCLGAAFSTWGVGVLRMQIAS